MFYSTFLQDRQWGPEAWFESTDLLIIFMWLHVLSGVQEMGRPVTMATDSWWLAWRLHADEASATHNGISGKPNGFLCVLAFNPHKLCLISLKIKMNKNVDQRDLRIFLICVWKRKMEAKGWEVRAWQSAPHTATMTTVWPRWPLSESCWFLRWLSFTNPTQSKMTGWIIRL